MEETLVRIVINGQNAIAPGSDLYTRESAFMSDKFPSSASGFDANDTPHLFDAIRLVVVNGQQGREIMLQRPTITSMDFGEIDHAGNEPNIFSIELEYENFVIGKVIENPLENFDIEKFSIYGTGNWTDEIAKSKFDIPRSEQNFRVKAGQEMPAADLMDASRRSSLNSNLLNKRKQVMMHHNSKDLRQVDLYNECFTIRHIW